MPCLLRRPPGVVAHEPDEVEDLCCIPSSYVVVFQFIRVVEGGVCLPLFSSTCLWHCAARLNQLESRKSASSRYSTRY